MRQSNNLSTMRSFFKVLYLIVILNKFTRGHEVMKRSDGSLGNLDLFTQVQDIPGRLNLTLIKIRRSIDPTVKSIQSDIAKLNRDRIIIGMANCIAGIFGIMSATGPHVNLDSLSTGQKVQALSSFLYGYGYSRPWQDAYENPILDCGIKDLEMALKEYEFLNEIQSLDIHRSILEYYTTELNHELKKRLYCITQRRGTNQAAKDFIALIDIFTDLQQELIETK